MVGTLLAGVFVGGITGMISGSALQSLGAFDGVSNVDAGTIVIDSRWQERMVKDPEGVAG